MDTNNVEQKKSSQPFASEDLREIITKLLLKHHHLRPTAWLSYLDQQAYENAPTQDMQRFLINRAWRDILSQLDIKGIAKTLDERYSLIDTGRLVDWVSLFEKSVIPCIITHALPLTN